MLDTMIALWPFVMGFGLWCLWLAIQIHEERRERRFCEAMKESIAAIRAEKEKTSA